MIKDTLYWQWTEYVEGVPVTMRDWHDGSFFEIQTPDYHTEYLWRKGMLNIVSMNSLLGWKRNARRLARKAAKRYAKNEAEWNRRKAPDSAEPLPLFPRKTDGV
jgi:hypothetical protein